MMDVIQDMLVLLTELVFHLVKLLLNLLLICEPLFVKCLLLSEKHIELFF